MWSTYGKGGEGCCLVINWREIADKFQFEIPLYRVCYINAEGKNRKSTLRASEEGGFNNSNKIYTLLGILKKKLREWRNKANYYGYIFEVFSIIRYLFKSDDYAYEGEYRLIYSNSKDHSICHTSELKDIDVVNGEVPWLFLYTDFPISLDKLILGPKQKNKIEIIPFIQESVNKMAEINGMKKPTIEYSEIEYK